MEKATHKTVAIVGIGAVMPDAHDLPLFWNNIKQGKYSVTEVPENRWSLDKYYDPDPKVPDKTYSKIGGWVKDDYWDPLKWGLPIPPRICDQMDNTQRWAISATRQALADFGFPEKDFDRDRTAVIFGVAMGGDQHLYSAARIFVPEYIGLLDKSPGFATLPADLRKKIIGEMTGQLGDIFPSISEDTMPGELSNIVAGRIAALYNFHGPNYVADAACASAMAGISAAIEGLVSHDYDMVVTGGIDANMSPTTFVKFCKIGALSATGTRPYAEGADGFIMGEGAAVFLLKRLADAERDGDKIYAVIRSVGGSSDGKGKGITAPNPAGQVFAVKRAWENSGVSPSTATMIEGHGTSTSVGDAVELKCLQDVFGQFNLPVGSIALGSIKSNIGHLKGAAGAAGIAKAVMSLHEKVLPPSINFHSPNSGFEFEKSPFAVNTHLRPWEMKNGIPRRCGVSAFGFGGTNFHVVLEEHIPGKILSEQKTQVFMASEPEAPHAAPLKVPLRGAMVKGTSSKEALVAFLEESLTKAEGGWTPAIEPPLKADLKADHRIALDFENSTDLAGKIKRAINGLQSDNPKIWDALNAKGIFYSQGPVTKTAFLFTGQGSQYINMLKELKEIEPIVKKIFDEADEVMKPLLGKPLTEYIFFDRNDKEAVEAATKNLMQTEITQPAVLSVDYALFKMMEAYGIKPDYVMGHSLGEYGALVASGALEFASALKVVSARGAEMANVKVEDKGIMAAVFASPDQISEVISKIDGYVEIANVNSFGQCVIGGETESTLAAMKACKAAGYHVTQLPVSHAFHTRIVAPASIPFANALRNGKLKAPSIPVISNVTGEFYPTGADVVPEILDLLSRQIASPVQFVKGINKLYESGVRVFVECGPKRALHGFVKDITAEKEDVMNLFTNQQKGGDIASFNQALCGLYAAGLGYGREEIKVEVPQQEVPAVQVQDTMPVASKSAPVPTFSSQQTSSPETPSSTPSGDRYSQLGKLFVEFMDKANAVYSGTTGSRPVQDIWITGAAVGLPKVDGVFSDSNVEKLLNGEQLISNIPAEFQQAMLDRNITRLVKMGHGGPRFETISTINEVIKLAARKAGMDLAADFGYPSKRMSALDITTELAIGAGIDAMRDAGIPMVMHYKTTTTGSKLPDRWLLPAQMQNDTGIIFCSAFPGYNNYAKEMREYFENKALKEQLSVLNSLRTRIGAQNGAEKLHLEIDSQILRVQKELEKTPYSFNRRFLLRVLAMGHSQFAEYIGAKGPNTQINSACASTTLAVGMAKDWIEAGRCKRVIIIAADDITADETIGWFSSGFLAAGAAATDARVEDAALPFDKRRHGMIVGMGGAAIVVESGGSASERGIKPICEVLSTVAANSAFHATQLDVDHIKCIMEDLIAEAERKWGIDRYEIAAQTVFVSHETYTPARGGSASAEIFALRHVFQSAADKIVIANTKGMTGHAMAVGIEDILAIKSLETGWVPPVPNFKEVDPELGMLNLSKGGAYPIRYALRLGAGFGSQIAMSLLRWTPASVDGSRPKPNQLGYAYRINDNDRWRNWLKVISGKDAPEMEVVKRTLRIKDKFGELLSEPEDNLNGFAEETASTEQTVTVETTGVVVENNGRTELSDPVRDRILTLISEKTGYPVDMLNPDLDLEADLGIDTVKQAELFAEIRGEYGIERDDNVQLSNFPTLNHIIQFVYDKRPGLKQAASTVATSPTLSAASMDAPATAAASSPLERSWGVTSPALTDGVKEKILFLIAEKTGYPVEMLDPELDLEADLGIDTVKQAELFAEIRGNWGIDRDDNLQLADFPTINHIVQFVYDRKPELKQDSVLLSVTTTTSADLVSEKAPEDHIKFSNLEAVNQIPRRIPTPQLRPALKYCKASGVQLNDETTVLVMPDNGGVAKSLLSQLKKSGAKVHVLDQGITADQLSKQLCDLSANGPIHGVYWLPALDYEGDIEKLSYRDWKAATQLRVKLLYATMRELVLLKNENVFLVSATCMGGHFGYDENGALAPLGGAVSGFTKAYKREHPAAQVKVVDFEKSRKTTANAQLLIDETLLDPGIVEVGYKDEQRWSIGLQEVPVPQGSEGMKLTKESTFLVTGAAGSITSAITADLAAASSGTFFLLDLTPSPDQSDADLIRFANDKEGLKREIFNRMTASGDKPTPVKVDKELAAIERRYSALAAIEAVEKAGGTAHYYSVDLRDQKAVAAAVKDIKKKVNRIDVMLHAGGLEISRLLPDKSPQEFDLVFDVKADGWYNLLSSFGEFHIGATVAFSSIAGRFGNGGQTDYSSANDFLCKSTSSFRTYRPETRGIALDWTAWGGIGMATRGSIPTVMKQAGIDMLPPEAGIPFIRKELTAANTGMEVVVAQRLGRMMEEFDYNGGLQPEAVSERLQQSKGVMVQEVVKMGLYEGLVTKASFNPKEQGFLFDHQINGTPVLPGVMGIEAMVDAATCLFPELHVQSVEAVDFFAPFKFYRSEPREVFVKVIYLADGSNVAANCELFGTRKLHGQTKEEVKTHFSAKVFLGEKAPEKPAPLTKKLDPSKKQAVAVPDDIYKLYFHGPAYQVIEKTWKKGEDMVGLYANGIPANHHPEELQTLALPRFVELCFQVAGITEMGGHGRMGLPRHLDSLQIHRQAVIGKANYYAVVSQDNGAYHASVVDSKGEVYLTLKGYQTVEFISDFDKNLLVPLQAVAGGE